MSHDLLQEAGATAPATTRRGWRNNPGLRIGVCLGVIVLAIAWIAVRGLTGNFVYYLTPTDILAHHKAQVGQRIRLGGYVEPGTVHHSGSFLLFTITDGKDSMKISDVGAVPELFKAGQGVVLEGAMGRDGMFHADTLLVKHNGTYAPPKPGQAPPHRANLNLGN